MGNIYVGTSGFSYREWLGRFYPRGLKGLDLLDYYAARFNAVELNNTFYQLPAAATLASWRDSVGPDFRFAVKAGQRITHRQDCGIPGGYFESFLDRIALLGGKLGPVLFQFPPAAGDPQRIMAFIAHLEELLPSRPPLTPVIELRNPKLLNQNFIAILHGHHVNLCINDAYLKPGDWPEPLETVYLRLRNSPYDTEYLKNVAVKLRQWSGQGKDCYVFFKHEDAAPELAQEMQAILRDKF